MIPSSMILVIGMGKLPGMIYILFSFTPWITYWVLTSIDPFLGLTIPLIISFTIFCFEAARRDLYFMDVFSLIYFTIALLSAFLAGTTVFVEYSGALGYSALTLMSALSIALKKPFTLRVARRDWPEPYWREKTFIYINNVISALWMVVFGLNALISFLVETIGLILSNALIAFAVVFSTIYPIIASRRLVVEKYVKPFEKYDWSINVSLGSSREEDEYDAVIVGAGIGGLTCGSLLAKNDYKVLVLEQHHQVGGYCSSFSRKGFLFNAGVEDVSGLWSRGPVSYLLRELGLDKDDLFVRNSSWIVFKGEVIDASEPSCFIEKLSRMFPSEKSSIEAFFTDARVAYDECYKDVDEYGVPLPAELIAKVFGVDKLVNYPREHPHFYGWMSKSFREKLDEYFINDDLKMILSANLGYVGVDSNKIYASTALTACLSYLIHGGYHVRGGAQRFSNALKDYIERNGGVVSTRHRVDRIIVENGAVRGVVAGNRVFKSNIVVANANAKTALLKLVGGEYLGKEYVDYINGLKMSPSAFLVFLGVEMDLSSYPNLIKDLDHGIGIFIDHSANPSLPHGKAASVTLMTLANYSDFPRRGTVEYLRMKNSLANGLIKKAERIIPGLSKSIVVKDAATPLTFERYTSTPEGAIYGFDQSIETKRPYFKTPIVGLYLTGASTFPGGGVEAVVISGIICSHDIRGWLVNP